MTKTKLFIRFLKDEKIYFQVMRYFKTITLFYDGMIEEITIVKSLDRILFCSGVKNYYEVLTKWRTLCNNTKLETKPIMYTNWATQLFLSFLKINDIEKEVTEILYDRGNIDSKKINTNDIDKLLRKHKVVLYEFFMDANTFCSWSDYDYIMEMNKKLLWNDVDNLWRAFLKINKIPNIYV